MINARKQQQKAKCSDPMIVARVKNYLAENVDKTFVDVSQMAKSLKERYREYGSRNESAFCQMVEAAYKVVLKSYGLDDASSSEGSEEESDDLELLDDSNVMNDQLAAMYKRGKKPGDKTSELIDISSDDDSEDTEKQAKLPKLNDQITISPHVPDANAHKVNKPVVPVVSINARTEVPRQERVEGGESRKRRGAHDSSSKGAQLKRKSNKDKPGDKGGDKSGDKGGVSLEDVGGLGAVLEQVGELVLHMRRPEVYRQLGVRAPKGALLHGPPGTGKTLLAHALATRLQLPLINIPATELVGGVSGESEKNIRELFERAAALAPCVLFIDEIDSICANRLNAQKEMERRIVSQLLSCIDSLTEKDSPVLLLAATSSPDSLDPALRRAGRLEQEIALGIPNLAARKEILHIMCRGLKLGAGVQISQLALLTPGYVGADLRALINKACTLAIKRVFKELKEKIPTSCAMATNAAEPAESAAPMLENGEGNIVEEQETKENGEITSVANNEEGNTGKIEETPVVASIEEEAGEESTIATATTLQAEPSHPGGGEGETPAILVQSVSNGNECSMLTSKTDDFQKYLDDDEPISPEQLASMTVIQEDFLAALKSIKPCAKREGFATVPDTTWDDIGSLSDIRRELQLAVLAPVKYPEQLESLGLAVPSGVLLCGPPGCGKTLLAKAVANEAGINFISVKGPELLNMYVGESERAVRTCFQRARNSAPCVIFFDEFDSLCPRRVNGEIGGATRVVNQLLTEMDGIEGREGVFVLAATNRPDIIDPAVLRPGRLDRVLFVGMPMLQDREDILKAITKKGTKPQLAGDVDICVLAAATEGYTGADLAGLVRQAATQALTDFITGNLPSSSLLVSSAHFQKALMKMRPSVSPKEQQHYEKLRLKYTTVGEEKIDVEMDTEESMDTV